MTHTFLSRILNFFAAFALLCGIGTAVDQGVLYASVTGGGATIAERLAPAAGPELRQASSMSITNDYQAADAATQLTLGILLIVLGFFLHGLSRMRSERPVPITIAPPRKKGWFWVHMHI